MSQSEPQVVLDKLEQVIRELRAAIPESGGEPLLIKPGSSHRSPRLTPEQSQALDWAQRLYKTRRARKKVLSFDLFAEPAWDILLDLFVAFIEDRKVSVTSACIAADVPTSTGLRWLARLEEDGLIQRFSDIADQRVTWVCLTRGAVKRMFRIYEHYSKQ